MIFISKILFIFNFCKKKAILKFDIHSISFITCIPKVSLFKNNIPTSQLVFYLFNIGMTQLIYHLLSKNGGGFRTYVTFSMELFATIIHGFQTMTIVAKSCLIDWARFIDPFLKKILLRFKLSHKWKMITVYVL